MSRRKYRKLCICLSIKDRKNIQEIMRNNKTSPRVLKRVLILNMLDKNIQRKTIAISIGISAQTVRNIAGTYIKEGLNAALYDSPRPGNTKKITHREKSNIIAIACSEPPQGSARWTLKLLAEETIKHKIVTSISSECIRIIMHSNQLKPWREKMWCIPKLDAEYIKRMEDILDTYEKPYNKKEPVVCLDEKPIQLLASSRKEIPADKPGKIKKKDYEYVRCGTANVFCAIESKPGKHFTKVTNHRTAEDFAEMLYLLANSYSKTKTIHLVMDNLNTHNLKSLIKRYGEEKGLAIWNRFTVHYTPTHASWLNQAEIKIGIYGKQCLGKNRIATIDELKFRTKYWNKRANKLKLKINWGFTSAKAQMKFKYEKQKN